MVLWYKDKWIICTENYIKFCKKIWNQEATNDNVCCFTPLHYMKIELIWIIIDVIELIWIFTNLIIKLKFPIVLHAVLCLTACKMKIFLEEKRWQTYFHSRTFTELMIKIASLISIDNSLVRNERQNKVPFHYVINDWIKNKKGWVKKKMWLDQKIFHFASLISQS